VALLKHTQLMDAKWQFPLCSKRQCLCCGTGRHNQLFKCRDVTIGNMENKHLEDSPSSESWNSFKRQVVSCIRRLYEVIGPFFLQEQTMNSTDYLDMLELFAVPQMVHFQANIFFQQDSAPPHWGPTVRESLNIIFPNSRIGLDGPVPWPLVPLT
jgi:hypothetical protein